MLCNTRWPTLTASCRYVPLLMAIYGCKSFVQYIYNIYIVLYVLYFFFSLFHSRLHTDIRCPSVVSLFSSSLCFAVLSRDSGEILRVCVCCVCSDACVGVGLPRQHGARGSVSHTGARTHARRHQPVRSGFLTVGYRRWRNSVLPTRFR